MKHRFSRMLISMFAFLCPTFVRARFGRRQKDAQNKTPPTLVLEGGRELQAEFYVEQTNIEQREQQ